MLVTERPNSFEERFGAMPKRRTSPPRNRAGTLGECGISPSLSRDHSAADADDALGVDVRKRTGEVLDLGTVSYTHLTLPTIYSV